MAIRVDFPSFFARSTIESIFHIIVATVVGMVAKLFLFVRNIFQKWCISTL